MFYSLLSKFRGAWLGSIIGQKLKTQRENATAINLPLEQLRFSFSQETELAVADQWNLLYKSWDNSLHSLENYQFNSFVIDILPIILYYHDDWSNLANFLNYWKKDSFQDQEDINNTLIWCYVVRLALRGKLIIPGLTDCVVMGTGLKVTSIQWLKTVEMSCLQGLSTNKLIKKLSSEENLAFPLSLYCFLHNPHNFWLTIQQASSLEEQAIQVTALSGFLSGAYNGLTGIPLRWRRLWQNYEFYQQIQQKTADMMVNWSGIESGVKIDQSLSVIASAQVLQPRKQLKIISQQEYESDKSVQS